MFNPEHELEQINGSVRGDPAKTCMYLALIAKLLIMQLKGETITVQDEEKKPGEVHNGSKVTRKR